MRFELYSDINKFHEDLFDALLRDEVQNDLIISNTLRGLEGADTSNWLMAAVHGGNGAPLLIAFLTPPHNILLYEVDNKPNDNALTLLAKELVGLDISIQGVLAEKFLARRFSDIYSSLSGKLKRDVMKMRIYKLERVEIEAPSPGRLRPAEEHDHYFLPYWLSAFVTDCGTGIPDLVSSLERARRLVSEKALYIWEDRIPVSQAATGRKTVNGAVVNGVYTPPHFRGRGYATSCVASLSKILLERGYKFCSLFTDLSNPISNSIYMKIGYKPLCDCDEYKFLNPDSQA